MTKLDKFRASGLIGCLNGTGLTSENYNSVLHISWTGKMKVEFLPFRKDGLEILCGCGEPATQIIIGLTSFVGNCSKCSDKNYQVNYISPDNTKIEVEIDDDMYRSRISQIREMKL